MYVENIISSRKRRPTLSLSFSQKVLTLYSPPLYPLQCWFQDSKYQLVSFLSYLSPFLILCFPGLSVCRARYVISKCFRFNIQSMKRIKRNWKIRKRIRTGNHIQKSLKILLPLFKYPTHQSWTSKYSSKSITLSINSRCQRLCVSKWFTRGRPLGCLITDSLN